MTVQICADIAIFCYPQVLTPIFARRHLGLKREIGGCLCDAQKSQRRRIAYKPFILSLVVLTTKTISKVGIIRTNGVMTRFVAICVLFLQRKNAAFRVLHHLYYETLKIVTRRCAVNEIFHRTIQAKFFERFDEWQAAAIISQQSGSGELTNSRTRQADDSGKIRLRTSCRLKLRQTQKFFCHFQSLSL